MSDSYMIRECIQTYKEYGVVLSLMPSEISGKNNSPVIQFHHSCGITMKQAQAICDLLNNWKDDEK